MFVSDGMHFSNFTWGKFVFLKHSWFVMIQWRMSISFGFFSLFQQVVFFANSFALPEIWTHTTTLWIIWGLHIVPYLITAATIFGTIGTLCITPVLFILLVHLTISPYYQKLVLSSCIFAALNIFDGIKMSELFLAQNESYFHSNKATGICIIVFVSIRFVFRVCSK